MIPQDMIKLWDGDLCDHNRALQFLLIMDYVAEWARDVYRENVIHQLKVWGEQERKRTRNPSPAKTYTSTVRSFRPTPTRRSPRGPSMPEPTKNSKDEPERNVTSTTVASDDDDKNNNNNNNNNNNRTVDSASPIDVKSWIRNVESAHGDDKEHADILRKFDVKGCAYRDARFFRSRVIGLYITKDTIKAFDGTAVNEKSKTARFRRIALNLSRHDPLYMQGGSLNAMEQAWLGTNSSTVRVVESDLTKRFYVICTFSSYLSPDWQPTRELCYIAVRGDTLKDVMELGGTQVTLYRTEVTKSDIRKLVDICSNVSVGAQLAACLHRCTMMPFFGGGYRRINGAKLKIWENTFNLDELVWQRDIPEPYRNMVWRLYKTKYLGDYEVESPYLRSHDELQEWNQRKSQPTKTPWRIRRGTGADEFIPCELENTDEIILCNDYNKRGRVEEHTPDWCLFFLDRSKLRASIQTSVYKNHQITVAYRTQRVGRGTIWRVDDWNAILAMPDGFNIKDMGRRYYRAFVKSVNRSDFNTSHQESDFDIETKLSQLHLQSPRFQNKRMSATLRSLTSSSGECAEETDEESIGCSVPEFTGSVDEDDYNGGYESSTDVNSDA
ncbi:hypothetical protein QQS21_009105 [Conoideocrella luteorostrata]|uniref:Uncharacterized protein n=1 Tax=Conoideocrella luteorostrata TaxID=1105319 RepID=A0AAJ0CHL0_9HYPO|nr:hypothetical protein QQS21_009105 [Conoideocrella luteorostrata]